MTAGAPARPLPGGRLRELARAALAPLICAAVLTGLLSAWVAGGGGTIRRVRIEVTLAAVPMPGYAAGHASLPGGPATYLTIRNLSGSPDELIGARSSAAARVQISGLPDRAGHRSAIAGLPVPADGTVSFSAFGRDLVLLRPVSLPAGQTFPLTLTFRHAGQVTVELTVTPPGTP